MAAGRPKKRGTSEDWRDKVREVKTKVQKRMQREPHGGEEAHNIRGTRTCNESSHEGSVWFTKVLANSERTKSTVQWKKNGISWPIVRKGRSDGKNTSARFLTVWSQSTWWRKADTVANKITDIKTDPLTLAEIKNAIKGLKIGKVPGEDLLLAELLKANIDFTAKKMNQII